MNNLDLISLIEKELMFTATYDVQRQTCTELNVNGVFVSESATITESLSLGSRRLDIDEIIEAYEEEVSWLK